MPRDVIGSSREFVAQGGGDVVPVRLKNAVLRILGRSKYRQYYLQQQQPRVAAVGGAAGAPGTPPQGTPTHSAAAATAGPQREYSPFGRLPSATQPSHAPPEATAFSHPSNMHGLMVHPPLIRHSSPSSRTLISKSPDALSAGTACSASTAGDGK